MIRPLTNQVLIRILPPESHSSGGIEFPQHTLSPEERQERNHNPEMPSPLTGQVVAIGPWPKLKNGLVKPPPFPPDSKVLIRPGSGHDLAWGVGEKFKMVNMD